jgi:hypothetical protein
MTINRGYAAAGGALAVAAILLFLYDPADAGLYPSCPLRALTGLLCPLCGGLRAAHALLHGRVFDAVALNPFLFAAGFLGPVMPLRWTMIGGGLFMAARNIA